MHDGDTAVTVIRRDSCRDVWPSLMYDRHMHQSTGLPPPPAMCNSSTMTEKGRCQSAKQAKAKQTRQKAAKATSTALARDASREDAFKNGVLRQNQAGLHALVGPPNQLKRGVPNSAKASRVPNFEVTGGGATGPTGMPRAILHGSPNKGAVGMGHYCTRKQASPGSMHARKRLN